MTPQENPGGWPDAERPGLPPNHEKRGWHWLTDINGNNPHAFHWVPSYPGHGHWKGILPDGSGGSALDAAYRGWFYWKPCPTSSEVAALVEAARVEAAEGMRRSAVKAVQGVLALPWLTLADRDGASIAVIRAVRAIDALPLPSTTTQRAGGEDV